MHPVSPSTAHAPDQIPYTSTPRCVGERERRPCRTPSPRQTATWHSIKSPFAALTWQKPSSDFWREKIFILAGRGRSFPSRTRRTPHPGQSHAMTRAPPNICTTKMFLFYPPKRKTPDFKFPPANQRLTLRHVFQPRSLDSPMTDGMDSRSGRWKIDLHPQIEDQRMRTCPRRGRADLDVFKKRPAPSLLPHSGEGLRTPLFLSSPFLCLSLFFHFLCNYFSLRWWL